MSLPATDPNLEQASPAQAGPNNLRRGLHRFLRNRRAVLGICLLAVLLLITLGAPVLTPLDPNGVDLAHVLARPGAQHWFGTDNVGRDYFARSLYGGRISLFVGFSAMLVSIGVGTLVGSLAGFFGGALDEVISRAIDFILSLPIFYIIIIVQMLLRPGTIGIVLLIGLSSWMVVARLVRGLFLREREQDYVQAARAMGAGTGRMILRHLLPNVMGPIIVTASFNIGDAILVESALSFLGVGIQPPTATWGNMIIGAEQYMFTAPWIAIFPGIFITLTVMSFMFVGDGLRDALDSKMAAAEP